MRHIESLPRNKSIKSDPNKPSSKHPWLKSISIASLLMIALGYGMTQLFGSPTSDKISDVQKKKLINDFTQLSSVTLEPISETDYAAVLDTMKLPPLQRKNLQQTLQNDQPGQISGKSTPGSTPVSLAWITLWDFATQDGDVVHVSSSGYEIDVPLLKQPKRIVVPIDASQTVKITGTADGGGGITLGIMNGATSTSLPVLKTGQSFNLPVSF